MVLLSLDRLLMGVTVDSPFLKLSSASAGEVRVCAKHLSEFKVYIICVL